MQFLVASEIFERFPGIRIAVAVAQGVDNREVPPGVSALWRETWSGIPGRAGGYGNAQSHPHVRPWREHFRAQGISAKEFPSSIETLLRRALKGGEPFSINGLVDFYNALSLRHVVPVGGFDLEELRGPLELRLTRAGDTFTALGAQEPLAVPAGEVAYADGQTVLTRHFVWRQAREGLIAAETRRVFLVSEVLGELEPGVVEAVKNDLVDGLRSYFDVEARAFIVDAQQSSIEW